MRVLRPIMGFSIIEGVLVRALWRRIDLPRQQKVKKKI